MVNAKVLKGFTYQGFSARSGEEITIDDKRAFRNLSEGGFIEAMDSKQSKKKEK